MFGVCGMVALVVYCFESFGGLGVGFCFCCLFSGCVVFVVCDYVIGFVGWVVVLLVGFCWCILGCCVLTWLLL